MGNADLGDWGVLAVGVGNGYRVGGSLHDSTVLAYPMLKRRTEKTVMRLVTVNSSDDTRTAP